MKRRMLAIILSIILVTANYVSAYAGEHTDSTGTVENDMTAVNKETEQNHVESEVDTVEEDCEIVEDTQEVDTVTEKPDGETEISDHVNSNEEKTELETPDNQKADGQEIPEETQRISSTAGIEKAVYCDGKKYVDGDTITILEHTTHRLTCPYFETLEWDSIGWDFTYFKTTVLDVTIDELADGILEGLSCRRFSDGRVADVTIPITLGINREEVDSGYQCGCGKLFDTGDEYWEHVKPYVGNSKRA